MPEPNDETCFLCFNQSSEITQEHIFPKWLQHKYALWDEKLTLLNGTKIPYRQLTIPCCENCNNDFLSQLENEIKEILERKSLSYSNKEKHKLFLWCSKITYGLLYKSQFLSLRRQHPYQEKIIDLEAINQFSDLRLFLQGIRKKHTFSEKTSYSVIIANTHETPRDRFDFKDSIINGTIAIRLGNKGIIVSLWDRNLSENTIGRQTEDFEEIYMHPMQFDELIAKVNYQATLIRNHPHFFTIYNILLEKCETVYVNEPAYNPYDWDNNDYTQALYIYWKNWLPKNLSFEQFQLMNGKDKCCTMLKKADGTIKRHTLEEWNNLLNNSTIPSSPLPSF